VPRQANPAGLRIVALALAIGGFMIGIAMPALFLYLGIMVEEIAPGLDLIWVLFPAVAIVDWIVAYYFWRKAHPSASGDGPVVG
jgi:hypothetical protein